MIVEEEETGDGPAVVRLPLVDAARCAFVVQVDLKELHLAVERRRGERRAVGRVARVDDWLQQSSQRARVVQYVPVHVRVC